MEVGSSDTEDSFTWAIGVWWSSGMVVGWIMGSFCADEADLLSSLSAAAGAWLM